MKSTEKSRKGAYHHGNLAESLLNAMDEIATQFGLEAVTLRACAKRVGVSPSSAFRHYADKRALLTAFATRALNQLCNAMIEAAESHSKVSSQAFATVGLAYVEFAIDKPAFFRAMWREETIYTSDSEYQAAATRLSDILKAGFADSLPDGDPGQLGAEELLAWSAVHGLANLFVDGPVGQNKSKEEKLDLAIQMLQALTPVFHLGKTDV